MNANSSIPHPGKLNGCIVNEELFNSLIASFCICFTNNSAKVTADQLQDIITDEKGLAQRGRALRDRVENEFSWRKIVDRHLELYKKLF